jgi:hypothetical protein
MTRPDQRNGFASRRDDLQGLVSLSPKGPIPESLDKLMEDPPNQSHQPLHWTPYPVHAGPNSDLHPREHLAVSPPFLAPTRPISALVACSFRET